MIGTAWAADAAHSESFFSDPAFWVAVAFFLFFARKPLLLFGMTGLGLAAAGVIVGIVTIVLRVLEWMPPFGFRPLLYLVVLLEVLGFLLFGIGFVAELIAQQQADLDVLRRQVAPTAHRDRDAPD